MSSTWLYIGAVSLFIAALLILGYEWWAWRRSQSQIEENMTISAIVRRWDRGNLKRRSLVFAAITIVAMSIQFLAIHFIFESVG